MEFTTEFGGQLHPLTALSRQSAEQRRCGFGYAYSVYQVAYSRNPFESGRVMERAFDTIVDRTRARMDVPTLRTLFGVGQRPRGHHRSSADLASAGSRDR